MKKYKKLYISASLLVIALIMVVAVSYAALTMSTNPAVEKFHVSIGGTTAILVAPDVTYVDSQGNVYHYPGNFSDKLDFSNFEQYNYVRDVAGLVPVSTADGRAWYLPTYYTRQDSLVQSGMAVPGQLRPTTEFMEDLTLQYANLDPSKPEMVQQGHYIYLDFWVVSPSSGYQLRVSDGDDGIGTYVIDLIDPEKSGDSYTLTKINQQAAASIRIGFLTNEYFVLDDSMLYYTQSGYYNDDYSRLQGNFPEPGDMPDYDAGTRFTIFEPNGDLHPGSALDGQYVLTKPLGPGGVPTVISDWLSVQLRSSWIMGNNETLLAQMFAAFVAGRDVTGHTAESLKQEFYAEQALYSYINKGNFISNTAALYSVAGTGAVSAAQLQGLGQGGATDDVYITELLPGIPQRIRMFIWLEGQDMDCINSVATAGLAISLELAGGSIS